MNTLPQGTPVFALAIVLICGPLSKNTHPEVQREKTTVGWIEMVEILPEHLSLPAKIDTGADNSSLNVSNAEEFMKGDKEWIRFSIETDGSEEGEDEKITFERPIVRYAYIKRKGASRQKRAVVLFDLCLGNIYKQNVPVNLADRTGFKYPMLIGRTFLKGAALVDSELTHTQPPSCLKNPPE